MNEEKKNQMVSCPVCKSEIIASAKFCPECGTRQPGAAVHTAWIAAAHEKIAHARDNDIYYTVVGAIGALTAIVVPFIMRFVLKYNMDTTSWALTIAGLVFFIGSYIGILFDERKMKSFIQELEYGPQEEEEEAEEQY